MPILDQYVAL